MKIQPEIQNRKTHGIKQPPPHEMKYSLNAVVSSHMAVLTQGHVGHLPARQAAALWHQAAPAAYEAS